MNSFEAMGQAHMDAAEGQLMLSRALAGWVKRATKRYLDRLARRPMHVAPW